MSYSFNLERIDRVAYAERSMDALREVLGLPDIQEALGTAAVERIRSTSNFYVPDVNDYGVVTMPASPAQTNSIPFLPLREGESVLRDAAFASFSPAQERVAPQQYSKYLGVVANRLTGEWPSDAFRAQVFDGFASPMRMTYFVENFPEHDKTMCFNCLPLVVLRYDPEAGHLKTNAVANALVRASYILENPIAIVDGENGFDAMNDRWAEEGELAASAIRRVLQDPQDRAL